MPPSFHWLDVRLIGELLAEHHPDVDPLRVRFVDLRRMVEALPGFKEEPGHPVNERILEEIQRHWIEEREDLARDDE
ncbi:MAG: Fe-S cluster assembly protein IscX [Phycisphaerae bacterium]|nr:Fe-S cluster assembly protein IscX [Phycisphaerae bacterium]